MELYFVCPVTGKGYWSENWHIVGQLVTEEDADGGRKLSGMVMLACPHCAGAHPYRVEELACPLSQAGK